jgi:hypothetical protein
MKELVQPHHVTQDCSMVAIPWRRIIKQICCYADVGSYFNQQPNRQFHKLVFAAELPDLVGIDSYYLDF